MTYNYRVIERALDNGGLSEEQMQHNVKSIFAEQAYHAMSDRYRFYPTIEAVRALKQEGFIVLECSENRARKEDKNGFQKHMLTLIHRDTPRLDRVGDTLFTIRMLNGHDGSSAYKLIPSIIELRCLNGMTASRPASTFGEDTAIEPISVRHSKYTIDEVIDASYRVTDAIPRIADSIQEMKAFDMNERDQIAFARAALEYRWASEVEQDENGKVLKITSTAPVTPEQLLRPRHGEDTSKLYSTLNVVQEHIIRGGDRGVNRNGGVTTTREVNSVTENTRLNRALWVLAELRKRGEI